MANTVTSPTPPTHDVQGALRQIVAVVERMQTIRLRQDERDLHDARERFVQSISDFLTRNDLTDPSRN